MSAMMMKSWSLFGMLVLGLASGCAAGNDEEDTGLLDNDYSYGITDADAKADASDVTKIQQAYSNTHNGLMGWKYLSLKSGGSFDGVLDSGAGVAHGYGTRITGTYKARNAPMGDDAQTKRMLVDLNIETTNPQMALSDKRRTYLVQIPTSSIGAFGYGDAAGFTWSRVTSYDTNTGLPNLGALQHLNNCSSCSMADYDATARNDDKEFHISISHLTVDAFKNEHAAGFDPSFPEHWNSGDGAEGKPTPQACIGHGVFGSGIGTDCTAGMDLTYVATTTSAGLPVFDLNPTGWSFTRTGAAVRDGFAVRVVNAGTGDDMGTLNVKLTVDQLDQAQTLNGHNGGIDALTAGVR